MIVGKEKDEMTIEEYFRIYEEKKEKFTEFVNTLKKQAEIAEKFTSASYNYEIRNRADDPTKAFVYEWLEIESGGYLYKINTSHNSALANELQLVAVLIFPEEIRGLMEKCEC